MRVLTIQTSGYLKRLYDKDLSNVESVVYYTGVFNEQDRFERDDDWENPVYAHAGIGTYHDSSQLDLRSINVSWCNWLSHTHLDHTVMIYAEVPDEYIVCLKEDRVTNLPVNAANVAKLRDRGKYEDFIVMINELKLEWVLSVYVGPCNRHYNTMDVKCIYDSGKAPLLWNSSAYLNGDGYMRPSMEDAESYAHDIDWNSAVLIDNLLPDKLPWDVPMFQLKGLVKHTVYTEFCTIMRRFYKDLVDIKFGTLADFIKDKPELEPALSHLMFVRKTEV